MKILPIILSGGAGTRLWPESRKSFPKPFLAMPDGETLIQKTLKRAEALAPEGPILTVTNKAYADLARHSYVQCGSGQNQHVLILEPNARNTAPAIAAAAAWANRNVDDDTCLIILPSDHLISDVDSFVAAAENAAKLASDQFLVTFGIPPTHPETGYGYIKSGGPIGEGYRVDRFVEKPDSKTAKEYLASKQYLWNSGMFAFTCRGFRNAVSQVAPELGQAVDSCLDRSETVGDEIRLDPVAFSDLPNISIDYAVFEKSTDVAVVAGSFDWNDIGSWQAISELSSFSGNYSEGEAVFVESTGVYVRSSERLVATVGVDNLVVVDTPDALLITDRHRSQGVKAVVDQLKSNNSPLATDHRTQEFSWGSDTHLWADTEQDIRRVTIKPQHSFEIPNTGVKSWGLVVKGSGLIDSKRVEPGTNHCFSGAIRNDTGEDLVILVVRNDH